MTQSDIILSPAVSVTQAEKEKDENAHHHHKHHHHKHRRHEQRRPSTPNDSLNVNSGRGDNVSDYSSLGVHELFPVLFDSSNALSQEQLPIKVDEGHDLTADQQKDIAFLWTPSSSVALDREVATMAESKYYVAEASSVLETDVQVDRASSSGVQSDMAFKSKPQCAGSGVAVAAGTVASKSDGFKGLFKEKCKACHSFLKDKSYLPIFLLLSVYGLFSAILLVVNYQTPEVVCANSFSRGIVEDARLCYPDLSILACQEGQVLSLTGECPDGDQGEVICGGRYGTALNFYHEGVIGDILANGCWSEDSVSDTPYHYVIKANPFLHDEQCVPPQFGSKCACCNDDVCETRGRFLAPVDLPIAWSDDVRYPHFGPGCTSATIDSTFMTPGISSQASNTECRAYCSDGTWVDTQDEAKNRRWFVDATYVFAWISIGLEALCFVVALFHGVFPMSSEDLPCKRFPCKPVTAPLISYYTLIALGSEHERNYECADRTVVFLNGIEAITSAVMSGIVVFRFDSLSQMRYQWQYLNFFITRLVAILSFFKEVYKANREHLEMRRIDAAVQSREETQANIESQAETHQEQKPSTTRECKSYKKSIVFFVLLLAVCATAVTLGLLYDPPAEYHSPRPPPTCNATEYALDPKNQEFFLYYDADSSGGLSFTEYDAYIDCLYEDRNSLPPKELCDNNGDGEIFFYEYKLCAEMTDIFMYSEDSENFYKFDMDNSGGLSPKEFQIYYLSIMSGDFAYQLPDDYLDIYFGGNSTAELTHNEYVYHPYTTLDLVDTDRDGLLSKQEFLLAFQWALQSYIKTPKSDGMYDEYFAEGDENADGKLSFEEWGTLLNFVIRDEDSDGKFSRDELGGIFCNPGMYLAKFDYNQDHFLSYDEYLAMDRYDWSNEEETNDLMLDEYNSFDYDKDGFISRDELSDNMKCWTTSVPTTTAMLDLYMTVGDRDGDGKIGYAEWNFLKFFFMIDNAPKDGFLSEEEFDWFVSTMGLGWDFDSFDNDKDAVISLEEWMVNAALAYGIDYNNFS